jgi:hypothetical protein
VAHTRQALAGNGLTPDIMTGDGYRNVERRNLRTRSLREFRICSSSQKAQTKQAPRQIIRMQKISFSSDMVIRTGLD